MSTAPVCRVGIDLGGTGSRAIGVIGDEVVAAADVPTAELGRRDVSSSDHLVTDDADRAGAGPTEVDPDPAHRCGAHSAAVTFWPKRKRPATSPVAFANARVSSCVRTDPTASRARALSRSGVASSCVPS